MDKHFYFLILILLFFSSCSDSFENEALIASKKQKLDELHTAAKDNIGEPDKAFGYAEEMLVLAAEINSQADMGDAYNIMGAVSRSKNNYVSALKYYLQSSKAFELAHDTIGMAKVYNNIGNIYRDITKYDNAIRFYQKSLTAKTLLRDKEGMAVTNRNMAFVYQLKEDYERAKDSYWTSLYIWKTLKDEERMAQLYNDLGIIYDLILDKNLSSNYEVEKNIIYNLHLNSLEISQKIHNSKGIGYAYNNIATSLVEKKEYEKALSYLQQSVDLKSSVEDTEGLATTYNNIGYIYLYHKGNTETAIKYFKLAEKFAEEEELEKTYEYLSDTFEKKGNFSAGYDIL